MLFHDINICELHHSSVELESQEGKPLELILNIPLLSGNIETIKIEFIQKEKNVKKIFEKLRKKYLNVKRLADEKCSSNEDKIKKIKKEFD